MHLIDSWESKIQFIPALHGQFWIPNSKYSFYFEIIYFKLFQINIYMFQLVVGLKIDSFCSLWGVRDWYQNSFLKYRVWYYFNAWWCILQATLYCIKWIDKSRYEYHHKQCIFITIIAINMNKKVIIICNMILTPSNFTRVKSQPMCKADLIAHFSVCVLDDLENWSIIEHCQSRKQRVTYVGLIQSLLYLYLSGIMVEFVVQKVQ